MESGRCLDVGRNRAGFFRAWEGKEGIAEGHHVRKRIHSSIGASGGGGGVEAAHRSLRRENSGKIQRSLPFM